MLIYSLPRSGSSAFQHQLERDHHLLNIREYFNWNANWVWYPGYGIHRHDREANCNLPHDFDERLKILKTDPSIKIEDVVVKLLSHHLNWTDGFIETFKDQKIFVLNRRNTYRQFLSWVVADTTKIYHQTTTEWNMPLDMEKEFSEKIFVKQEKMNTFLKYFKWYVQGVNMFKVFFNDVSIVHYEDLKFDEDGDYKKFNVDYEEWFINTKEIKEFTDEVDQYKLMLFRQYR